MNYNDKDEKDFADLLGKIELELDKDGAQRRAPVTPPKEAAPQTPSSPAKEASAPHPSSPAAPKAHPAAPSAPKEPAAPVSDVKIYDIRPNGPDGESLRTALPHRAAPVRTPRTEDPKTKTRLMSATGKGAPIATGGTSNPASYGPRSTGAAGEGKTKRKKRKSGGALGGFLKFILYMVFVLTVSALLAKLIIGIGNDMFAFIKEDREVTVVVPEGADTSRVAKILGDSGVVSYPQVFRLYADFKKGRSSYYTEGYNAGSYTLSPNTNYDALIFTLSKSVGDRDIVRITFPEGCTVDEVIDLLIHNGIQNSREDYVDVIQNYDFDYRFVKELDAEHFKEGRKYRLEGYLFPDTYDFYTDSAPSTVIDKFLANFNSKFDDAFYERASELGESIDDVVILASLVEKEARLAEDYDGVASVFRNRLNNKGTFPYLQSDASIQYSFPKRKSEVSSEDLKIDDPYNTYLYAGLPPSAIANPGLDAITAVLYGEETPYYYFVANSVGKTLFAKTYEGHLANIDMIRKEAENPS